MDLHIYREGGSLELLPETLARELRMTGLVVFTSGRMRQRAIASTILELVRPDIRAIDSETRSPNDCMCVFDLDRYSLSEVLTLATAADEEFEKLAGRGC